MASVIRLRRSDDESTNLVFLDAYIANNSACLFCCSKGRTACMLVRVRAKRKQVRAARHPLPKKACTILAKESVHGLLAKESVHSAFLLHPTIQAATCLCFSFLRSGSKTSALYTVMPSNLNLPIQIMDSKCSTSGNFMLIQLYGVVQRFYTRRSLGI